MIMNNPGYRALQAIGAVSMMMDDSRPGRTPLSQACAITAPAP